MDGVLIIDKPEGPTSNDIVQLVKRATRAKKVGHLGTLDPAATGVLPVALNKATKLVNDLKNSEKVYEFILVLGVKSDTDDDTGRIIAEMPVPCDFKERLEAVIPKFIGRIYQRPPVFSAVKIKGTRACDLARRGEAVIPAPKLIQIDSISIVEIKDNTVKMHLECRSGTYVRSLARDLGDELGCGALATKIRRLKSGPYTIDKAISMPEFMANPEIWEERIIWHLH